MDIWNFLKNTEKPIALYGMGNGAQRVINKLNIIGKNPVGVFASDGFVRHQTFAGFKVTSYDELARQYPDMIILICFGTNRQEVLDFIKFLSSKHTVLCPDVPVYGENIFDIKFARENSDKIRQVYDLLSDHKSKDTFRKIIEFKLSGESEKLYSIQYEGGLFDLLNLTEDEIYVDAGAYRGDTVEAFIKSACKYNKIYAFEPNQKTYNKLIENVKGYTNVQSICAAISDLDGETQIFSAGRGSSILKKGNTVSVCSLDSYLQSEPITLIKMDVEGEEKTAILGAKNLISEHKPKMIIAAYHRSEDIFSLPLLVHKIRPDYKIFLRHFPHNLAWDSNYYFI